MKTAQKRVLLVDDAPMNLKILSAMLRKLGCIPAEVASGKDALDFLQKNEVDAVLTDLWMLEMNGADLADAIKKSYPSLPVFGVTADSEAESKPYFTLARLDKILIKPVTLQKLKEILELL